MFGLVTLLGNSSYVVANLENGYFVNFFNPVKWGLNEMMQYGYGEDCVCAN